MAPVRLSCLKLVFTDRCLRHPVHVVYGHYRIPMALMKPSCLKCLLDISVYGILSKSNR